MISVDRSYPENSSLCPGEFVAVVLRIFPPSLFPFIFIDEPVVREMREASIASHYLREIDVRFLTRFNLDAIIRNCPSNFPLSV